MYQPLTRYFARTDEHKQQDEMPSSTVTRELHIAMRLT